MIELALLIAWSFFSFWLGFNIAIRGVKTLVRRGELEVTHKYEGGMGRL